VERPDGLKTADLVVGTGAPAARGARIVVEYTGWVADSGVMFDSSFVRSDPFVFTLGAGQVIRGWDKGVKDMRVGGTRMLYIPSYLAYSSAAQGEIPAYADLVFQVQLLDVQTRP
jgi:FKBP-type peptidyl-prolyl cis-trans isomerase